eukprot:Selendium_serpulae@DN6052_c1_g1_i2.p4
MTDMESRTAGTDVVRRVETGRVRLHCKARVVGYRRCMHDIHNEHPLVKIEGVDSKEEANWYLGKRVVYVYKAGKVNASKGKGKWRVIPGKIRRVHGNGGVVRAKFRRNLPGQAIGVGQLRVYLYPNRSQ